MTLQKLPQDLDENSADWCRVVNEIKFCGYSKDLTKAVPGTISVYIVTFVALTASGAQRRRYYIGQGRAEERADAHKSEYLRCKTTTRTGKSKLYCAGFLSDVLEQRMEFLVHSSGYTSQEAKEVERRVSKLLIEIYGDEVITKPTQVKALSQAAS
jgi:hypothetical protein